MHDDHYLLNGSGRRVLPTREYVLYKVHFLKGDTQVMNCHSVQNCATSDKIPPLSHPFGCKRSNSLRVSYLCSSFDVK